MTVPFLRNAADFSFDSELLRQASHFGLRIEEVPARGRYFGEASPVGFRSGAVYGLKTLWAGTRLMLHRGAISVHSVEHVPDPDRALAEMLRVVRPGGIVTLLTPNRLTFACPDEIIDPYHYAEYDARQLRRLCTRFFEGVEVWGLFGSGRYLALVADDRRVAKERADPTPGAATIGPEDFTLGRGELDRSLDLLAVCGRPVRS